MRRSVWQRLPWISDRILEKNETNFKKRLDMEEKAVQLLGILAIGRLFVAFYSFLCSFAQFLCEFLPISLKFAVDKP